MLNKRKHNLEDLIESFETLNKNLIDFDIECIRKNTKDLYSAFHCSFYSLRGDGHSFLSKYYLEVVNDYEIVCAHNKPVEVSNNIQAMQWVTSCLNFLRELDFPTQKKICES